jgi:hypothetical protein
VAAVVADDTGETDTEGDRISPFWGSAISQWNRWIVFWAQERGLSPDLVAAVVRQESIGRANAEGPYGAVGLMMVLPAEKSGMPWRPTAKELTEPNLNLRWGTGILREILRETGGDVINSLAAYNGGWDQLHIPSTKRYAHKILNYFAYAIAARQGYSYQEGKVWTMVILTRVDKRITLIQVDTSQHFLAPCLDSARGFREVFPEMAKVPRTRVAQFIDEQEREVLIDAWLFVGGLDRYVGEMLAGTSPPTLPRVGFHPKLSDMD